MEEPMIPTAAVARNSESVIDNIADPKQKRAMQRFRDAVLEKLTRSHSFDLTPPLKSLLERRLLQLIPVFHTPSHPTYALMILRAIRELDEGGSNEDAISSFIKTEYDDLPLGHKSLLSRHLSMLCDSGEICVDEERRYKPPSVCKNGTEGKKGNRQKGFSRRQCRSRGKGIRRREREFVMSGKENQSEKQRNVLIEEQGFTRAVQFSGERIGVGSQLRECSVKVGGAHNESEVRRIEVSGDRDMITEANCEGVKHDKLREFSVEEVSGAQNPAEVQETEVVENQDMVTEEQSEVVKEIIQESDDGNCSSVMPELCTSSHLTHSLDQNVKVGDNEAIGLQIQSEVHQSESMEGENQPREQLDAITEHNQWGRCPKEGEVEVLSEQNESRELKNDIIEEKSLPPEQIVGRMGKRRRKKRKIQQTDGKPQEAQRRSKRLQMLLKEHESVSDAPSVELDKGQQGEIRVGREQNQQGLQIESMEGKSNEKEKLDVNEEGGKDDANGEQNQSDPLNSEVVNEQTHRPQRERLELIKEQDLEGCVGTKLGKENMVGEESPSHKQHSKMEDKALRKETTIVAFYRRSKRLENIVKEPVSDGLLRQLEKSRQGEMGEGKEQNQQECLTEEQNQVRGQTILDAEQIEQGKYQQKGKTEFSAEQDQSGGLRNFVVDSQSPSQEKQFKMIKELQVRGLKKKHGRPRQQEGALRVIGKPNESEILHNETVEVQSNAKEQLDMIGEQTQGTRCQDDRMVEESSGQDHRKRYGNKRIGEQVEVAKEATMLRAVTTNKKVDHKHEQGQSRSREGRPCKDNVAEEGSWSLKQLEGKKLQKNRRMPVVVRAMRQSPRLQGVEKGEKSDGQCYRLPEDKRPRERVQSVKKDNTGQAGKPVMSASETQPDVERHHQEMPEQRVDAGVEQNREEMQIEMSNEQFEEQERERGESGNLETECEIKVTTDKNEAKDGTDDTSLPKEKRHQKNPRRPIVVLALRHSPRPQDKEKGADGQFCKLVEEKSLQKFVQKGNKGNKRQADKPVKSASPTQPKGQRHQGEQNVVQEQQLGVNVEQSREGKQMEGHEEERLEKPERETNEPQNPREECEIKVIADKNEATHGKEDILKEGVIHADDVCYNPLHFQHDLKIYRRRSVRRKESGGLIFLC